MPPTRRIRRAPLMERIKAYLDPLDFMMWVSEELETSDWEEWQQNWAVPLGIALNLIMMIARANSAGRSQGEEEIFGTDYTSTGWMSWLATFVAHFLSILSVANAFNTFYRKRHYRLFEQAIDEPPSTPSARRVKVDSSPMSGSPLRLLSELLQDNTAQSRAHPDAARDVWELSVWDPTPICLKMFCLFSPGHIGLYWLTLPTRPTDPRPSVTVATTMVAAMLLSVQLWFVHSSYSRQIKDNKIINKEVLNEYDVKYVHPITHPVMRDVGTQISRGDHSFDGVTTYSPVTIVNRGFKTNPNPNYVGHVDPEASQVRETPHKGFTSSAFTNQTPSNLRDITSPLQQHQAVRRPAPRASTGPEDRRPAGFRASVGPGDSRPSSFRSSMGPAETGQGQGSRTYRSSGVGTGDGGSLGVYSHAQSPLKKSRSTHFPANPSLDRVRGSPTRRESGRF